MSALLKVHLGSGPNILPGWTNVDYNPDFQPEVIADLKGPFPFESSTVDFIHSEGCLCQFDLRGGQHFVAECFRILKPGGVMRVLSPDLRRLLQQYLESPEPLVELWRSAVPIPLVTETAGEVVNTGIRDLHQFMYDAQTLEHVLRKAGFEPYSVAFNESAHEPLRGIDVRAPADATYMYYECRKPA